MRACALSLSFSHSLATLNCNNKRNFINQRVKWLTNGQITACQLLSFDAIANDWNEAYSQHTHLLCRIRPNDPMFLSSGIFLFFTFLLCRRPSSSLSFAAHHISLNVIKNFNFNFTAQMHLFIGIWGIYCLKRILRMLLCFWCESKPHFKSISNCPMLFFLVRVCCCWYCCHFANVDKHNKTKKPVWNIKSKTTEMINCWEWQLIAIECFCEILQIPFFKKLFLLFVTQSTYDRFKISIEQYLNCLLHKMVFFCVLFRLFVYNLIGLNRQMLYKIT